MCNANILELIKNFQIENAQNKKKSISNVNKKTNDIEPFENKAYLEMITNIKKYGK